jgi:two-component system cell cycle response regulator
MARVLVIEDNPASLDLMVYLLKAFGHTPLAARDGLEGIETARRERPDLVLCDIQLPGADGHEVCRQLKQDKVLRSIPLVAVTAYAMVGDREKLLGEGFNGYLSKPINPQTFITEMTPYLQIRAIAVPSATRPSPPRCEGTEGSILVVDNSPVNIKLSRSLLEPFGYKIIEARSVDVALKLLEEQRPDVIVSDIHMPNKDGFDFIQAVKADANLRGIPFVFITSTVWGDRERDRGLSLGAAQFIIRPIDSIALVEAIDSCRMKKKGA